MFLLNEIHGDGSPRGNFQAELSPTVTARSRFEEQKPCGIDEL